jgi:hypothetical protein
MRSRLLLVSAFSLAVLVATLAQTQVQQSATPPPTDERKPGAVETPTSDIEASEAGRPVGPQVPGQRDATEQSEPLAPGQEVSPAQEVPSAEEPLTPAQEVPPAEESLTPSQQVLPWQEPATPIQQISPAEAPLTTQQAVVPTEASRIRWRFTPLFGSGVYYDDNIFFTNTDRVSDVIWTISAGLAFELGDFRGGSENYLTARWIGVPTFYTNNPDQNAFNQTATLLARYRWAKLVGQLESNFAFVREANREVNTITTTTTFFNRLRFTYDYSGKTSFDLLFGQSYSESSEPAEPTSAATAGVGETKNSTFEVKAGMNYQMLPKTSVGLEVTGGITDESSSPLQYYQQGRLRLSYVATGKLTFKLSGGVEAREFEGSDRIKATPVFSLGLEYRLFDATQISVMGYRNVSPTTAITGQDTIATGFEIIVTQRLFQKFIAGISFGYENDQYFATSQEATIEQERGLTDRVDDYMYVRPRLSYSFIRWVSASIFYEFRRNASNEPTSSFYNNRVGLDIATEF